MAAVAEPVRSGLPRTAVDRLVVPVDLSDESWRILPLARAIAKRLTAEVEVVFVDVSTLGRHPHLDHSLTLCASVDGAPLRIEVVPGSEVAPAINEITRAHPGSAVLMSTHGLGGFGARAWGSVCAELLESNDAGALVVGPNFDEARHTDITRIVACVDGAAPDQEQLHASVRWAEALRVPLVVASVFNRGASRPGEDEETDNVKASLLDELPVTVVPVSAEVVDDPDVCGAVIEYADRYPGTLLSLATGAAYRCVHALTASCAMIIAHESATPMLLRRAQR